MKPNMNLAVSMRWLQSVVILVAAIAICGSAALSGTEAPVKTSAGEMAAYRQAARYSRAHRGVSMLVMKNGRVAFQDYASGHTADEAHNLYSGTKSFSCAIAVAAIEDGLLSFDEPVAQTITAWQTDPQKSKITIRQLLTLTSGIDAGKTGSIPLYAESINAPVLHPPGTVFQYGPTPFQIFGELMRRKLMVRDETVRGYLTRRIFDPIGLQVSSWRTSADGNPRIPTGAFLTAEQWAKYGELILNEGRWGDKQILNKALLCECFRGTAANPGYGVTFWLPVHGGIDAQGRRADKTAAGLKQIHAPDLIIKAAGVGGQKLYIMPSLKLVIVRQASRLPLWGRGFEDAEFLAPIFKAERDSHIRSNRSSLNPGA